MTKYELRSGFRQKTGECGALPSVRYTQINSA
jgi:hypothetical protein